jgi:hypothetical protein
MIGDTSVPSGTYVIRQANPQQESHVFQVYDTSGNFITQTPVGYRISYGSSSVHGNDVPQDTSVILKNANGNSYLSKIWFQGINRGYEFAVPSSSSSQLAESNQSNGAGAASNNPGSLNTGANNTASSNTGANQNVAGSGQQAPAGTEETLVAIFVPVVPASNGQTATMQPPATSSGAQPGSDMSSPSSQASESATPSNQGSSSGMTSESQSSSSYGMSSQSQASPASSGGVDAQASTPAATDSAMTGGVTGGASTSSSSPESSTSQSAIGSGTQSTGTQSTSGSGGVATETTPGASTQEVGSAPAGNSAQSSSTSGNTESGSAGQLSSVTGCLSTSNVPGQFAVSTPGSTQTTTVIPAQQLTAEMQKQIGHEVRLVGEWQHASGAESGSSTMNQAPVSSASPGNNSNTSTGSGGAQTGSFGAGAGPMNQPFLANRIDVISRTCSAQ